MGDWNQRIQVLRTIDKMDKIGLNGVREKLQAPREEFGAELHPIQAELLCNFIRPDDGPHGGCTIETLMARCKHLTLVSSRFKLIELLDGKATEDADGQTAWDRLLSMPVCARQSWENGCRPENIGWALDDLTQTILPKMAAMLQEEAQAEAAL
ncbi:MAG: hypothetical protein AAF764_00800 [Pseudomonadota bacterium]